MAPQPWLAALACTLQVAAVAEPAAAPGSQALTAVERRWLEAGWPVIDYARSQQLPIDIVVQPQDTPGLAPLAMGFVGARCKLVLSMRGNPEAEAPLEGVEPMLMPVVIEAMTAHEIGHCWRYVQGAWHTAPAGFVDPYASEAEGEREGGDGHGAADAPHGLIDMRATRREEGYADLVGLAWVARRHPHDYARVHAWLARLRAEQPLAGAHHDTRAWLGLARQRAALAGQPGLFDAAQILWTAGLALGP